MSFDPPDAESFLRNNGNMIVWMRFKNRYRYDFILFFAFDKMHNSDAGAVDERVLLFVIAQKCMDCK